MTVENKQIRKFEVVKEYEGKGVNLPIRKTKYSCGYDIESAEDTVIPSIWQQMFGFINENEGVNGSLGIERMVDERMDNGHTVGDIMKEFNLRPTLIPTGLKAYMHDDENVEIISRSSNPMKNGLIVSNSVGLIDCDYVDNKDNEGHMFVQVLNFLPFSVTVKKNQAIAQAIFRKFLITDDDNASGERVSGFGSTDDKADTNAN